MAGSSSWGARGWGVSLSGLADVRNLFEEIRTRFEGEATYIVGPTVEYAIYHELGTSKLEARPFMRPAARRVDANTGMHVRRMASMQGIPLDSEENICKCAALAVEREAKQIATRKDVRETGTLIGSIEARKP